MISYSFGYSFKVCCSVRNPLSGWLSISSFPSYSYKPLFNYQAVFALLAQGIFRALVIASG